MPAMHQVNLLLLANETKLILTNATTSCDLDDKAYELNTLTLTIPLWTFITFYLLLLLVHYVRRCQYFTLYDRCQPKNAHFRYDFHLVAGRYSSNFSINDSHIIVDLLDNQLVSAITIQVPTTTIYTDNQLLTYRHSRANLRCVNFSIYRRHPIKDVNCIRVAHSCSNPDSRLYIYGINLYDATNAENKFIPVTSVVKNRGTQWALNTTFEPKMDTNFAKMGCDCHDPFGCSSWPTYIEILVLIFYLWSSTLCFGYLIPISAIWGKTGLHALIICFIAGSSAGLFGFLYIRFIKTQAADQHSEPLLWFLLKCFIICIVISLSVVFWALATGQMRNCYDESLKWVTSTVPTALILTLIVFIIYYIFKRRKWASDKSLLEENDQTLIKTNSKTNLEFTQENIPSWCCSSNQSQPSQAQSQSLQPPPPPTPGQNQQAQQHNLLAKKNNSKSSKASITNNVTQKGSTSGKKRSGSSASKKRSTGKQGARGNDETLDNAFANSDGVYMKTKNRNSISQYV